MNLKCLIVDDEPVAQDILERYLDRIEGLEVTGKCVDAVEAANRIKSGPVDVIFLDIEMPYIDGLTFVKTLKTPPKIVVTTAYREYAIDSFELDVLDYLLKPISFERFLKAVDKITRVHKLERGSEEPEPAEEVDYIYLRADNKMVQIPFSEIQYIQSLSNYVKIVREGKSIISYQKLSHLEKVLPSSKFMRVHRSYIVPLKKIKAYTSSSIELEQEEIPLGGSYKDKVIEYLERFEG